jgi:glycine hydroxymethyltransferase
MATIAGWIERGVEAARHEDEGELERIRGEVEELAAAYPPPGMDRG